MSLQKCGKPIDSLLERVLCLNIVSSDYYKELLNLKSHLEVVDEIYEHVDHVEPWMTGNCRGPSTAFCLLYRLFSMDLTVKQVKSIIHHVDSPYIRAIGFLYLRYIADPKTLWGWFEPFLKDEEEFSPGSNGRMTTMGIFIRDVLLGQYYFDSLFPRIPVPVMRQVTANLERLNLPSKPAGVVASASRSGAEEGNRRPPSVKAALSVSFGQRAPHRASTRDASPIRRVIRDVPVRSDASDRPQEVDRDNRDTDRYYRDRERDRDKVRDRDRERDRDKVRDRDRERDRDKVRDRDRERDRDRDRYRDKDHGRHGSKDRDRDVRTSVERRGSKRRSRSGSRSRSRSRSPGRHRRSGEYERRHDDRQRDRDNTRGREPSSRERESDPRDKFKETGAGDSGSSMLKKLKDIYGDSSATNDGNSDAKVGSGSATEVLRLGGSSWR